MPSSQVSSTSNFAMPSPSDTSSNIGTTGVGLSDASLSQYRRQLLDLMNQLHSTGVQVDIDLPQIAVIGSQSAGKSSLIESISGITLPRAMGTCTRCPTECRLSRSNAPWQCEVSLRFTTDPRGQPLGQARTEPFGKVIHDKSQVEDRIRRAQRAILNPTKKSDAFLEGAQDDTSEDTLSFSSNCVSLKISGEDVADLSFVDLPGLIASVSSGRGHSSDIDLIKSLVVQYIQNPSCIILLTVNCETDFENQGAHRITKEHDPEGKRTIGVLTKPDRIETGEEHRWLPLLRNEKETLEHNWYCVKQPSSADLKLNLTWADARRLEDEFFSMTSAWASLDPMYHKYLRTSNLVERLSSVLSDLIAKRLPQIQNELERAMKQARDAMRSLPPPPSSVPIVEVAKRLSDFVEDLTHHFERGVPEANGLYQSIRPAESKFRRAIRETAPAFRPFEKNRHSKRDFQEPEFLQNEEEPYSLDESDAPPNSEKPLIFVDEVFQRSQEARTIELPDYTSWSVEEGYIKDSIQGWKDPSLDLLQSVRTILLQQVQGLVTNGFADYGQGLLQQRVRTIVQKHLNECFQRAEDRLLWLLELESRPFTLNAHYLADYKEKFINSYKGARERETRGRISAMIDAFKGRCRDKARDDSEEDDDDDPIVLLMRAAAKMGIEDFKVDAIYKLCPKDQMEPAIEIMAGVRAYFQVAYKRFADNVPQAIHHELIRGMKRDMLETLYSQLGLDGPEGHRICKDLAQESPQIAGRRLDLQKKIERLETASSRLLNVGTSVS